MDEAFQLKGTIEYHTEGAIFEDMKKWNPAQHPGNAAAALRVEVVYSGSEKLAYYNRPSETNLVSPIVSGEAHKVRRHFFALDECQHVAEKNGEGNYPTGIE